MPRLGVSSPPPGTATSSLVTSFSGLDERVGVWLDHRVGDRTGARAGPGGGSENCMTEGQGMDQRECEAVPLVSAVAAVV